MAQQIDQIQIAEAVGRALELVDEEISLLDLVKNAVPSLDEDSIRSFVHFIVNGKKVIDADMLINQDDVVKVVPCFAGGN